MDPTQVLLGLWEAKIHFVNAFLHGTSEGLDIVEGEQVDL